MSSKIDARIGKRDVADLRGKAPEGEHPETPQEIKIRTLKELGLRDVQICLLTQELKLVLKPPLELDLAEHMGEDWLRKFATMWREAAKAAIQAIQESIYAPCLLNVTRAKDGSFTFHLRTNPKNQQHKVIKRILTPAFMERARKAFHDESTQQIMNGPTSELLGHAALADTYRHYFLYEAMPSPSGMHAYKCIDVLRKTPCRFVHVPLKSPAEVHQFGSKMGAIAEHVQIIASRHTSDCGYFTIAEEDWHTVVQFWEGLEAAERRIRSNGQPDETGPEDQVTVT